MTNIGKSLSKTSRALISQANTKHTQEDFIQAWERYHAKLEAEPKLLPTITGYCLEAGIYLQDILSYSTKFPEVDKICQFIAMMQEEYCITRGITQQANPIFSMFLLKSKHNYKDSPQALTQNNYMNISPDVLKDALSLMQSKDKGV